MLDTLTQKIYQSPEFFRLTENLPRPGSPLLLRGCSGSLWAFVASFLFNEFQDQILVVVPEKDFAERLRDDCAQLAGEANVRIYIKDPPHAAQALDMSAPIGQVETLKALAAGVPAIYITHAAALAWGVPEKKEFLDSMLEIGVRGDVPFEQFLEKLNSHGFERKQFVESYGDVAVRGGIVDVFPFIGEHPVRIEFYGDTVESIREFDVLSQRSIRELERVSIVPDIFRVTSAERHLLSFFSSSALVLSEDAELLEKEIVELINEGLTPRFSFEQTREFLNEFGIYQHLVFSRPDSGDAIDFHATPPPPTNGAVKILVEQIRRLTEQGLSITLASDTEDESTRIKELLAGADETLLDDVPIDFATETVHAGFLFPSAGIALLTEHEVFGRLKRRGGARRKRFKGISAKELSALRRGDFVVHLDHGIGKFLGLQKIRIRGVEQEAAKVEYAEKGVLFVNLNYINALQKYSSSEGHVPRLNRLGGGEWEKLKARVKKKIKDIARDLILLYAKRKHEEGFAFPPDQPWQKEMEASFMYEDTPDQASSTAAIKLDMESSSPMDRLICGDVGFGKTEIAVRAAFKAVQSNKQVAVLVPTTILAHQHYQTFIDRLGRYPVRIQSLSRFRSPKEQKQIVESLANGTLDIVIGTHRLLSKDVKFKDLGLLIIDEEHRFGVAAKEKLRALRSAVDTLTLTATPIPRTLHFSLMGARDLSLINTPPRNRMPISTEIVQFDRALIREAIIKEMHRGGQVYVVNDRVENIELFTGTLREIVPEARFLHAHGQMKGHELERVMMEFLERKCDVLVATKIIESGLDIPNVNTIIINRADRFGMAELYQLRGRVGRSNVQAYAYLIVPPISILPKHTLRRLQAIEEFTELGSGFNLAMRDLEIRGAGNMLGAEQSGFIMEMGFEMFTRTLEEAVHELKTQEFTSLFGEQTAAAERPNDTLIESDIEAYIPEIYVESDTERLDIYRRLYRTTTARQVDEIRSELTDRFGTPVEEVQHLLTLVHLRVAGAAARYRKIELLGHTLRLHFPPESDTAYYESGYFQTVMTKAGAVTSHKPVLKQDGKQLLLSVSLRSDDPVERIREAITLVETLRT
jgi:transcription-repair coupling factor (superfamily II helicase)